MNLYASRTIASAFGEVLFPIVSRVNRKPLIRSLEVTVAGRAERFSDFGTTAKPKFGLNFRPNDLILFRGTLAASFRAPNLVQINPTPLQRSGNTYNDIYRSEVTGLNRDSSAGPVVFRQGNVSLRPESSRSISLGLAVSASFYRDFTATVDYWRIKQKDVIDDVTGTAQLLRDEELLDGAVQKHSPPAPRSAKSTSGAARAVTSAIRRLRAMPLLLSTSPTSRPSTPAGQLCNNARLSAP